MPFQKGNTGFPERQRRAKLFADALRLELAAAGDDHKALRRVARALLAKAYQGEIAAIAMLADRLDGRVPQSIGGCDELGPTRLHISWGGEQRHQACALAAPALKQGNGIDGEAEDLDPAVRRTRLRPAAGAQQSEAQGA